LAPTLTVFDGAQNQLGTASGAGQYGSTLTVTVTGVTAGQTFYVKVAGSAATALGTGAYAVALNFGSGASPAAPAPTRQTANGSPMSAGGSQPQKTSLLGGLLGGVGDLTGGLLGTLLGISTTVGIGAGIGDALEPGDLAPDTLPAGNPNPAPVASVGPEG